MSTTELSPEATTNSENESQAGSALFQVSGTEFQRIKESVLPFIGLLKLNLKGMAKPEEKIQALIPANIRPKVSYLEFSTNYDNPTPKSYFDWLEATLSDPANFTVVTKTRAKSAPKPFSFMGQELTVEEAVEKVLSGEYNSLDPFSDSDDIKAFRKIINTTINTLPTKFKELTGEPLRHSRKKKVDGN